MEVVSEHCVGTSCSLLPQKLFVCERVPNISVDELLEACRSRLKCGRCFQKCSRVISDLELNDDGHVNVQAFCNSIDASEAQTHSPVNSLGFLKRSFENMDLSTTYFVPERIEYALTPFVTNLKTLLEATSALKVTSTMDLETMHGIVEEQNEYIGMMCDCVVDFFCRIYKFASTRPFADHKPREIAVFTRSFERVVTAMFKARYKTQKNYPTVNLTNIHGGLEDVLSTFESDADRKRAYVSVNVLNHQRVHAFRAWTREVEDELVVFEPVYVREMSRTWKYVDQEDFLAAYRDSDMRTILLTQFETCVGYLMKHLDRPKGIFSVLDVNEHLLGRSMHLLQLHAEIWTRAKDRLFQQFRVDIGTPAMRADIEQASRAAQAEWNLSNANYNVVLKATGPSIERTRHDTTMRYESFEQRAILHLAFLLYVTEIHLVHRRLATMFAFILDFQPAIRIPTCGTRADAELKVLEFICEVSKTKTAVTTEVDEAARAEELEKLLREMVEDDVKEKGSASKSAPKKKKAVKKNKMSTTDKKKSDWSKLSSSSEEDEPTMTTPSATVRAVVRRTTAAGEEEFDDEGPWERVGRPQQQGKKKTTYVPKSVNSFHERLTHQPRPPRRRHVNTPTEKVEPPVPTRSPPPTITPRNPPPSQKQHHQPVRTPSAPVQQQVRAEVVPVQEVRLNVAAAPFVPMSTTTTTTTVEPPPVVPAPPSVLEVPEVPAEVLAGPVGVPPVMYVVQPVPIFVNIPMYNPAMYYSQQHLDPNALAAAQASFDPQLYVAANVQSVPQNPLAFGQTLSRDFASPSFLTFPCVYY